MTEADLVEASVYVPLLFKEYRERYAPRLYALGIESIGGDAFGLVAYGENLGNLPESAKLPLRRAETLVLITKEETGPFFFTSTLCRLVRPAPGGMCIAPERSGLEGTLGGRVKNGDGEFLISASHLLTKKGRYDVGKVILQPHVDSNVIGSLSHTIPWPPSAQTGITRMKADAALVSVFQGSVSPNIEFIGVPTGVRPPAADDHIYKTGLVSGPTDGLVKDRFKTVLVDGRYEFVNTFSTARISQPGDSGALAIAVSDDKTKRDVVGLLFAHNTDISVYASVDVIISDLGLEGWTWT